MTSAKGPKILALLCVALWLGFVAWYGGRGTPMTQGEIDEVFGRIAEHAKNEQNPDGHLRDDLRALAATDDGNEFFMLNLIRYRPAALYPPGYDYGGSALDADARYSRAIIPYLLRHGGLPVFLAEPEGQFLHEANDTEWQRVALVRYRSRRDMLEMVADLAGQNVAVHKWASIEKTQVFPVRAMFSLIFVRGLAAALLLALGLVLHMGLKRMAWYSGNKG